MTHKHIVISLYDYTGEAVRPWAEAGYKCLCYDIQHPKPKVQVDYPSGGSISFINLDLHDRENLEDLTFFAKAGGNRIAFGMAFPVCTDLAVSGAAHFAKKAEADPDFQVKASNYAIWCAEMFDAIGCPYFIENPVSRLATLWRKPDHKFHPWQYGGYIPANEAQHPKWPEYIADSDAYPKLTCLWTGNGFTMPKQRPVAVASGYSTQHLKLGGKSAKTKNIRSATPRGFARAVFKANRIEELVQ